MPFSFHGHDIFFLYYFPFQSGDPYWPPGSINPYYPPMTYYLFSLFLWVLKPILPHLPSLFQTFSEWNFTWEGNTVHYAQLFSSHDLFRTLFVFKIPYLFFDYGSAYFLLKLIPSENNQKIAFKLWMLNPFVLHSIYALGQMDILISFFILSALAAIQFKRHYWAVSSIVIAALIKTPPAILLPICIVLMGDLKKKILLSLCAVGLGCMIVLPFFISSGFSFLNAILFSPSDIASYRIFLFYGFYGIFFLSLFFLKKHSLDIHHWVIIFAIPLLLFFAFYATTIRYLVMISPLLILIAINVRWTWIYIVLMTLSIFYVRSGTNSLQMGLFSALHPTFFGGLPIIDSFLNLFVHVTYLRQFAYKIFFLSTLALIGHLGYQLLKFYYDEKKSI